MGEVTGRIKPAAAHQGIGGADRTGVFEYSSQVVLIIFFEERTVNDAENVLPVIFPIAVDQFPGDCLQLCRQADTP